MGSIIHISLHYLSFFTLCVMASHPVLGQTLVTPSSSLEQTLNPGFFQIESVDKALLETHNSTQHGLQKARQKFIEKDYKGALQAIGEMDLKSLPVPERSLVPLLHGVVSLELGDFSSSESQLLQFLGASKILKDVGYYFLGRSYFQIEKWDKAQSAFEAVSRHGPSDFLSNRAQFYLGKIDLEKGRTHQAYQKLSRLRSKVRSTDLYPEILYSLMSIDYKPGGRNHCRWAKELYTDHPIFTKVAHWGLDFKKNTLEGKPIYCGNTVELKKSRLRRLQWSGAGERAAFELKDFAASNASDFDKAFMSSEHLINEGSVKEALALLLPLYGEHKDNFKYVMLLAKAASRAGEFQMATGIYLRAAKEFSPSYAKTALYRAAFLSYQHQDYDGAIRLFKNFKKQYPSSGLASQANWYLPWLYYLKGRFRKSYDLFQWALEKPGRRPRKISKNQYKYWSAMSLLKMGEMDQAEPLFSEIAADPYMGYYAVASVQRLRDLAGERPLTFVEGFGGVKVHENWVPEFQPKNRALASLEAPSSDEGWEFEDSLSDWTSLPFQRDYQELSDNPEKIFSELSEPVFQDRILRAKSLGKVGLLNLSKWELYWVELQARSLSHRQTLMFEYHRNEIFHRSVYLSSRYFSGMRTHLGLHLGASLWRFVYPRAYWSNVAEIATEYGVPQELIWSIMKAETNFRSDAVSPVGALGLMQVMPHTGRKVASLMGRDELKVHELTLPKTAIAVGGRYLQRVLKKFDQKIPLAAASYNGGPHRVHAWLSQFGRLDMDEFIDHIPFVETRNYVKRVVRYYSTYRLLYSKDSLGARWLSKPVGVSVDKTVPTKETWEEL